MVVLVSRCVHEADTTGHSVQDVQTFSLSGRLVTILLNYCLLKKASQGFKWVWPALKRVLSAAAKFPPCEEKERENTLFNTTSLHLTQGGEKEQREKRLKIIDKVSSISDVSRFALTLLVSLGTVGLALQGSLCLFNYYHSGPPAECLHLPLSEVSRHIIDRNRPIMLIILWARILVLIFIFKLK